MMSGTLTLMTWLLALVSLQLIMTAMHAVFVLQQTRSTMEITIDIPDYLYNSLQKYAAMNKETIEELILEILEETHG